MLGLLPRLGDDDRYGLPDLVDLVIAERQDRLYRGAPFVDC
jgi:hypothetical protein